MRGVVMSVKGRYAVLLNKNGEFVKVRNKNYTVGSTVSVASNTGRICALAASFLVVCGGIGSYFTPAGYVSVDINPSFLLTLNIYNKVIDIDALNDDAVILLEKTDVKGKNAEESVDMLIKTSEEIGYINENNNDVIVEVVSGIRNIEIADYSDVEVVVEKAEKADLNNAKEMGISIAKAKAIADYTKQNGGNVKDNAQKLIDQSVKEIRKGLEKVADEISLITPAPTMASEEEKVTVRRAPSSSAKKKEKKPVIEGIDSIIKPETDGEVNDTVTEVKPSIPATEIFRTPAPYFDAEKDRENEKEEEENIPSFPSYFMPQIQERPSGGNRTEENTSKPQIENDDRGNSFVKEEAPVENNAESRENEKQNDTERVPEKQENEHFDNKQETPSVSHQSDRPQNNQNSDRNEGMKSDADKSESSAETSDGGSDNESSGNESSSEEPSRNESPSAPSHSDNGSDRGKGENNSGNANKGNNGGESANSPHGSDGGNDRNNRGAGGGFGGGFGGEGRER